MSKDGARRGLGLRLHRSPLVGCPTSPASPTARRDARGRPLARQRSFGRASATNRRCRIPPLYGLFVARRARAAGRARAGGALHRLAEHRGGRRAGLVSTLGVHCGTLVHVAAAAIGLSSLLVSSARAFDVVKYAGAAYLVFLGVRTLLGRTRRRAAGDASVDARRRLVARRDGQDPEPEDGAVLPGVPAAVRRPGRGRGRAADPGARRDVHGARPRERRRLRARRGDARVAAARQPARCERLPLRLRDDPGRARRARCASRAAARAERGGPAPDRGGPAPHPRARAAARDRGGRRRRRGRARAR